jgi:hypothetical protein
MSDNNLSMLNVGNIVISNIRNSLCPRMIVMKKTYPIGFELFNVKTPFGIDVAYGKSYIKLEFESQTEQYLLLREIEKRLMILQQPIPIKSCLYGTCGISALLDKNVEIVMKGSKNTQEKQEIQENENRLTPISSYGISRGDILDVVVELGNIYVHNNECTYKYIVKRIIKH